jgi:hypothetical protein
MAAAFVASIPGSASVAGPTMSTTMDEALEAAHEALLVFRGELLAGEEHTPVPVVLPLIYPATPAPTPAGAPYWKQCSHVTCDTVLGELQTHHIGVSHSHHEKYGSFHTCLNTEEGCSCKCSHWYVVRCKSAPPFLTRNF